MARLTTIQIHQRYETLPVDILRSHRARLFRVGIRQKSGKIYILRAERAPYISERGVSDNAGSETRSIPGFLSSARDLTCFAGMWETPLAPRWNGTTSHSNVGTTVSRDCDF